MDTGYYPRRMALFKKGMKTYFNDRVAIVTGGASGLGRGMCESLGAGGAVVVVADIDAEAAEKVAEGIRGAGQRAEAAAMDVTDPGSVDAVVDQVVERHGHLDYMFNNAGIAVGGELQDVQEKAWRRVVEINLLGTIWGTCAAYSRMLERGRGHIVNVASMWGLMPGIVQSSYTATKHGVVGMTLALRSEAALRGVKVTAVCPGYVATNLFEAGDYSGAMTADQALERIPFDLIDVDTAVKKILGGVRANKAVVAFPGYVRFMWRVYRFSPDLFDLFSRIAMRMQQKKDGTAR